ncbi:MAG: hypothetical protein PVJ52_02060 [Candidatus Woesebacteria bacterium]|jgi:hypothetical protein
MPEEQVEVSHTSPKKEVKKTLELDEIIEIVDDNKYQKERDQFIEQRLTELQGVVQPKEFTLFSPPYRGFVHPDSVIKPAAFWDGFKVDDKSIYSDFVDNIRTFKNHDQWKTKTISEIKPHAILKTIGEYFGNYANYIGLEDRHMEFYTDHTSGSSESVSLSEHKGRGVAMCTEKSAVAQNLISFLGDSSELCISKGCEINVGKEEKHVFNIISSENGYFIFETSNPVYRKDEEDNIINYLPAIYKITDEQYSNLMNGESVLVKHKNQQVINGKYTNLEGGKRKYGGLDKSNL